MPSVKASQGAAIRSQLEPAMPAPLPAITAPESHYTAEPSPFMICSLPVIASGADAYVRQFYKRGNFPMQRILQPK